jgi:PilZ domain
MADIRTSRRFPVQLPLKVLGGPSVPVGTTANISAAGVYLWIDGGLEVGSSIDFEVTIPHESIGAGTDAHLHCHGRVLRCDTDQKLGRTGVACVIERYEFLRNAEAGGE